MAPHPRPRPPPPPLSASLAGRTAVVTGSTSGIGAATAHHLAARGAHVVVTGRDGRRGAEVVDAITASGGSAVFVAGDLTASPAHLRDLAAAWTAALGGRIDVLVHNAAVCPAVDTVSLTDDDLEATLAVNVRAPQVLTAAIAPAMVERGGGAIVVVGSWMASIGHAFVGFYSATKAAEAQLARSWAAEFGPARGARQHGRPRRDADPDQRRRRRRDHPDDRRRHPRAGRAPPTRSPATIGWLASDEASYVHGALIPVDGGITATR